MRKPHYWKQPAATSAPSNIVVVDTETHHGPGTEFLDGELQTLRLGVAVAYRLERGKVTREKWLDFTAVAEFWTFIESRLDARRPLWLVAHNVAYDLGVLGGWNRIVGGEWTWDAVAIGSGVTFLKGELRGSQVRILDLCNYHHCSLATVGRSVGIPKLPMPSPSAPDCLWQRYCRNDVAITMAALNDLIRTVREDDLGPWQPTAASLAFGAYRTRFMKHKVLVHSVKQVLQLERQAYYGGRVDCAFVGRTPPGQVYELDVCSMYPSVCREPLPIKLAGYHDRLTVKDLKRIAGNYQVIATVVVDTPDHTYPMRLNRETYYPTGRYETTLPTPEVVELLGRDGIVGVRAVAWYESAPIFESYMGHFLAHKGHARLTGDAARETLSKILLNSLYGKTGQRSHRWRRWCGDTMRDIESEYGLPGGSLEDCLSRPPVVVGASSVCHLPGVDDGFEVRDLWGSLEIRIPLGESRDSCPAIAAHVTSYARVLLAQYQRTAGTRHWYYSDTDSVWTDSIGLENLTRAGCVVEGVPGKLGIKGTYQWAVIYGPKDYETDTCRRVKGVRPSAVPTDDGGWQQLHFPGVGTQMGDNLDAGVYVRKTVKHLRREVNRVHVQSDGWTRPLKFPSELPIRRTRYAKP